MFFILIQYSIIISKLSNQNIILAQEISLIKLELEKIKNTLTQFGFSTLSNQVIDIMGRGINKSYIKIYVPAKAI